MTKAGVDLQRICVIPNAIDPNVFNASRSAGEAKRALGLEGKLVVGFTGFVRDWHGLSELLDWLCARAPKAGHALIVGEGPALSALKEQAHKLGIADRVTLTGLVERDRVADYVAAFDIAVIPKCVAYCSPLKLFEYMALGKPTVAPDQPNIREILDEGSAALFDPAKPGSTFEVLDDLAANPEIRRAMGERSKAMIRTRRLTWAENAARIVDLALQEGRVAATRTRAQSARA
jgi:glycosyltransferase involved in cell wall biosynthesis